MSGFEIDPELHEMDARLRALGRRVVVDPGHKARLRNELLNRQDALRISRPTLLSRFAPLWRLRLVALPALATVLVAAVVLSGLQISGYAPQQAADAARMESALARTVPTVTSWRVTVHRVQGETVSSCLVPVTLKPNMRLFVRAGNAYLYAGGTWYRVTTDSKAGCAAYQWAFLGLSHRLATYHGTITHILWSGRSMERVTYTTPRRVGEQMHVVALVDPNTGLVVHLERTILHGNSVVAQEVADYQYTRRGP